MKLTIAFDDLSLPLPPMAAPDVRQLVMEEVIDMAAEAGIDDLHIIAALGLHRRMTEDELRHIVGERIFATFHPDRSTSTTAKTPRTTSTSARRRRTRRSRSTGVRRNRTSSST